MAYTPYVDHAYYTSAFGGPVPPEAFPHLEIKAKKFIDFYTFNRLIDTEIADGVKLAACEIIDMLYKLEQTDGKTITSESIGTSHSMSYDVNDKDPAARKAKAILFQWLSHTGLMYRGV